jgi:hypothetical protein
MKFATFRGLMISGAGILCIGGTIGACVMLGNCGSDAKPVAEKSTVATADKAKPPTLPQPPNPNQGNTAASPPTTAGATSPAGFRPMDKAIMDRVAQNITGDKVKDAFPSQTYKVNLFKDAGEPGVNRVKIDLDRDEKWDEKWTITREGGKEQVRRQVSPADDDQTYTEEYRLREGSWVKK